MLVALYGFTFLAWLHFSFSIESKKINLKIKEKYLEAKRDNPKTKKPNVIVKFFTLTRKLIFQTYLINILLQVTLSFLGIYVSKLFFSFLLLDIVTISPSLKSITL